MADPNKHVEKNINSTDLLASQYITMAVADLIENADGTMQLGTETPLGLVMGINIGDTRPVNVQGEVGSNFLITLINEGQQQLSFQRLIPFSYESEDDLGGSASSALSWMYGLTGNNDTLMYDLDEYPEFKLPIQLVLTFSNYEDGGPVEKAKIWLRNASVASTSVGITAGSSYTAEPISVAWEDTIYLTVD